MCFSMHLSITSIEQPIGKDLLKYGGIDIHANWFRSLVKYSLHIVSDPWRDNCVSTALKRLLDFCRWAVRFFTLLMCGPTGR